MNKLSVVVYRDSYGATTKQRIDLRISFEESELFPFLPQR
jgi:hypothetical protein